MKLIIVLVLSFSFNVFAEGPVNAVNEMESSSPASSSPPAQASSQQVEQNSNDSNTSRSFASFDSNSSANPGQCSQQDLVEIATDLQKAQMELKKKMDEELKALGCDS